MVLPSDYGSSSGEREHKIDIQLLVPTLWVASWEHPLWSHPWGLQENKSMQLDHRESGWDIEVGERLEMTSPQIWADWVPTCRAHVQLPTGSFSSAEPRLWCNLTRKRGGKQACLSEVFKQRTLPALEPCQPFPCPGSVAES